MVKQTPGSRNFGLGGYEGLGEGCSLHPDPGSGGEPGAAPPYDICHFLQQKMENVCRTLHCNAEAEATVGAGVSTAKRANTSSWNIGFSYQKDIHSAQSLFMSTDPNQGNNCPLCGVHLPPPHCDPCDKAKADWQRCTELADSPL